MTDRILVKWTEIESITPWAEQPDYMRRKFGKWLRDNGYVFRSWIKGEYVCWTWESLLKAGICTIIAELEEQRRERKERR